MRFFNSQLEPQPLLTKNLRD